VLLSLSFSLSLSLSLPCQSYWGATQTNTRVRPTSEVLTPNKPQDPKPKSLNERVRISLAGATECNLTLIPKPDLNSNAACSHPGLGRCAAV